MTKITDIIINHIPKRQFNGERTERLINWFGKNISAPENRLIIGASALASQPFIDYYNKDVDEKTRKVSCARTIGKIIAGTLTGYSVREGFTKLVEKYSKFDSKNNFFTPSNASKTFNHTYKQYQNAMGMTLAIIGLVITNFAIDAPLTNFLTNVLTKKLDKPTNPNNINPSPEFLTLGPRVEILSSPARGEEKVGAK